jgi:cell division protein FtsB
MSSPALQPRTRVTRIAQEAVDRARLTVVPRVRTRAPRVPFVTLVSLVLVGGIVGLLLFNTSMQQASFAASSLEAQADTLAAREQTLRMELDELRDPQRVATQAQQMGMVIPSAPVFLDLESGTTSGVRTPATRENAIQLQPPAPVKPADLAPEPIVVEVPAAPSVEEQAAATAAEQPAAPQDRARPDKQRKNRNR